MTDITAALIAMANADVVALDTESTGLRPERGDTIRGFSLAVGDQAWYFPVSHPESENISELEARMLLVRVTDCNRLVLWNSSYDRTVLRCAYGIELRDEQIWDGLTVDWLMNESADHRLKYAGARVFGADAKAEKEALDELKRGRPVGVVYAELRYAHLQEHGLPRLPKGIGSGLMDQAREISAASKKSWSTFTAEDIRDYAVQDARLTLDLYHYQTSWLDDNPEYWPAVPREFRVEGLAYRMRQHGVAVDQSMAQEVLAAALERVEELASLWPGVNLRSAPQVQALVYDTWGLPCSARTKAGNRSTNKKAMSGLSYDQRVASLMEFRKLVKQIDAFYVPLINKAGEAARVHPSWHAHRPVTGRWSCSDPNLMQIPREGDVKRLFLPDPGFVFVHADLPSAELRVAALISGQGSWLETLRQGGDMHQLAADAAGITRQAGKIQNYQNLYGGGPKKLAEELGYATGTPFPLAEAKRMWRAYWAAVPKIRHLMDGLGEAWIRHGRLPIKPWDGRFRHRMNLRTGFPYPEYVALNSIIQGTIAELVKDWMLDIEPFVIATGGYIAAQIHDALVLAVPVGCEAAARELLQESFDRINAGRFDDLAWPLDISEEF